MKTYLLLWKIERRSIPAAFIHMAFDRFSLQSDARVGFFKSLGIGAGSTFTPSDADLKMWALLVTFDGEIEELDSLKSVQSWRALAKSEEIYQLGTISSHGLWAKKSPFLTPESEVVRDWKGEIATITRARIKWHENLRFWRAVPEVTASLHRSPGVIRAIGIGEAPIGLQGTFSHWRSQEDLRAFAYKGEAHAKAIKATSTYNWYAEELFARFAVERHEIRSLRD